MTGPRQHSAPEARTAWLDRTRSRSHGGFTVWPVGVGGRRYGRLSRSFDLWSSALVGTHIALPARQVWTPDSPTAMSSCSTTPPRVPLCSPRSLIRAPSETTAREFAEASAKGWPVVTYASR